MNKNNNNNKNNKISSQQICCSLVAANVLLAATCSSQLVATACQLICLTVRPSARPLPPVFAKRSIADLFKRSPVCVLVCAGLFAFACCSPVWCLQLVDLALAVGARKIASSAIFLRLKCSKLL